MIMQIILAYLSIPKNFDRVGIYLKNYIHMKKLQLNKQTIARLDEPEKIYGGEQVGGGV